MPLSVEKAKKTLEQAYIERGEKVSKALLAGKTVKEIAAESGVTGETIRQWLRRAGYRIAWVRGEKL